MVHQTIFACANVSMETVNSQRNIEIVYNAKVYDRHIKSLLLFPLHIIITIQQSPYISSFKTINVSIVCLVVTFFFLLVRTVVHALLGQALIAS